MPTIVEAFVPILVLLALVAFWHNALGARERARAHAWRLCAAAGLQLLDETVSLRRLRLQRNPETGWLQLVREYRFDVSSDGTNRLHGSLHLAANRLRAWSLPSDREES